MKKKHHLKERGLKVRFAPLKNNDDHFHGLDKSLSRKEREMKKHTGGKPKTMMSEYYF